MPVFFLVGGYANGLSWRSATRRGAGYGSWLRHAPGGWRPVLAVVGVCAGLGALAVLGTADAGGLRVWLLAIPLAALALGGVLRAPSWVRPR